jgi:peptide/nickel transport system permease protein
MTGFIVRKLFFLLLTLCLLSALVFVLIRIIPGDVVNVLLGGEGGYFPERIEAMRKEFGLDQPLSVQFFLWVKSFLTGNFGISLRSGKPVISDLLIRLPVTVELMTGALIVALLLGIPLGILAAIKRNTVVESFVQVVGLLGLSIPEFWWGTLLILGAAIYAPWIPTTGYVSIFSNPMANVKAMFLPILTLGVISSAVIMRMTRSAMLEVLGSEYIVVSRAKGLRKREVLFRHALRNALIPVVTVAGVQAGQMLGGAIVIEQLYALPGVGRFVLDGVLGRDYPVIQIGVLAIAMAFVVINSLTDILYAVIDPRVRLH